MQEPNGKPSSTRGKYAYQQKVLKNLCENSGQIDIIDTSLEKLVVFSGVSRTTLYRRFSCPEELSAFVKSNLFSRYEKLVLDYTTAESADLTDTSKVEYAVIAMFDMLHTDPYLLGPISRNIDNATKFLLQSGESSFIEFAARKILELTESCVSSFTDTELNAVKRTLRDLLFESIQLAFIDFENGISKSASWPWSADIRNQPLFQKTIEQILGHTAKGLDGQVL